MGILKFIVWTATCVAIGVWFGGLELHGKTPMQHLEKAWRAEAPQLEKVKEGASDLVDEVKKKVSSKERPTERHTTEDRDAIDKIIAKRAK
jgi:hypothetical protein